MKMKEKGAKSFYKKYNMKNMGEKKCYKRTVTYAALR